MYSKLCATLRIDTHHLTRLENKKLLLIGLKQLKDRIKVQILRNGYKTQKLYTMLQLRNKSQTSLNCDLIMLLLKQLQLSIRFLQLTGKTNLQNQKKQTKSIYCHLRRLYENSAKPRGYKLIGNAQNEPSMELLHHSKGKILIVR